MRKVLLVILGVSLVYVLLGQVVTPPNTGGGGGGGTPGGTSGQVQYNNASAFGGITVYGLPTTGYTSGHSAGTTYPTVLDCRTDLFAYTEFIAAATSAQVAIATVPANWKGWVRVEIVTAVTGGAGISAVSAAVGTLAVPQTYLLPFSAIATGFSDDGSGGYSASLASHAIYLQLAVTNSTPGNIGTGSVTNLTAGSIRSRLCGVTLQ